VTGGPAAASAVAPAGLDRGQVYGHVDSAARLVVDPFDVNLSPANAGDSPVAWRNRYRSIARRLRDAHPEYTVPDPTPDDASATYARPLVEALGRLTDAVIEVTEG
jgi:hypothetical protein